MFCLSASGDEQEAEKSIFPVERKYNLDECIVKLNFLWEKNVDSDSGYKSEVIWNVGEQIKLAVVSGYFPLFSGHTTHSQQYYVFYYADKCESRKELTSTLVQKYFSPNVANFPLYEIQDRDVVPGFDGAKPSGWWKDDEY
ncbi:MAG: hypothetical protein JKY76_02665 [Proteobacteria bacterium]|nr:hypothetical protein [Pseudomonadota bacterium]